MCVSYYYLSVIDKQIQTVRAYEGSFDLLGTAEKYISVISYVSNLSSRLSCMIYRRKFNLEYEDVRGVFPARFSMFNLIM